MKDLKDVTLGELCNYCQTRDEKTCNPTDCKYYKICDKIQDFLPYEWFEKQELAETETIEEINEGEKKDTKKITVRLSQPLTIDDIEIELKVE